MGICFNQITSIKTKAQGLKTKATMSSHLMWSGDGAF